MRSSGEGDFGRDAGGWGFFVERKIDKLNNKMAQAFLPVSFYLLLDLCPGWIFVIEIVV